MAAIFIAINGCDDGRLIQLRGSVVMRFFAGICRHVDYQSHALYPELVRLLGSGDYHADDLVHCVYECPSIMDNVKLDYSKDEDDAIHVAPRVGFDWYVTGYCISHLHVRWSLIIDPDSRIDLFLKSSGSSPNGRIQYLSLHELSLSQVFSQLEEFCQLLDFYLLGVDIFNSNDVNILRKLITPASSELRCIELNQCDFNLDALQTLFDQSSLEELIIDNSNSHFEFSNLCPQQNTNLKKLTISGNLIETLAAVLPNITSLTYLRINYPIDDSDLLILIDLVQSHTTIEVLELSIEKNIRYDVDIDDPILTNLPQLMEIADNSQLVLKIEEGYYEYLPDKDDIDDNMKRIMKMMTIKLKGSDYVS